MGQGAALFVDRVNRASPLIGLGFTWRMRGRRLDAARAEDEAYCKIMASMGEVLPRFASATLEREHWVIRGELAGHLAALATGAGLASRTPDLLMLWVGTWLLAIATDWVGGALGRRLHGWKLDATKAQ